MECRQAKTRGLTILAVVICLQIAIGASVALASRGALATEPLLRSTALRALLLLELFILVPSTTYLFIRYPDWSVSYLLDTAELSPPVQATILAVPTLLGVASFWLARRLLHKERTLAIVAVIGGSLTLLLPLGYFGADLLGVVGSYSAFNVASPTLRAFGDTALVYLVGGAAVGLLATWGGTLWRLQLVSGAKARQERRSKKRKRPAAPPRTQPAKRVRKKAAR